MTTHPSRETVLALFALSRYHAGIKATVKKATTSHDGWDAGAYAEAKMVAVEHLAEALVLGNEAAWRMYRESGTEGVGGFLRVAATRSCPEEACASRAILAFAAKVRAKNPAFVDEPDVADDHAVTAKVYAFPGR